LHLSSPKGAVAEPTFFSVSYDVWRRTEEGGSGPLPSMFPFETVLPEVFADNRQRCALPPTYNIPASDATDIRAHYLLWVVVEHKGSKLALWNQRRMKDGSVPVVSDARGRWAWTGGAGRRAACN
jgi:hypothetical protein